MINVRRSDYSTKENFEFSQKIIPILLFLPSWNRKLKKIPINFVSEGNVSLFLLLIKINLFFFSLIIFNNLKEYEQIIPG